MAMKHLEDLFVEELRDLYSAEGLLLKALPRMARAASHSRLRAAFEQHTKQTRTQIERLEKIFGDLREKPRGKVCKAMQGIIEEGKALMQQRTEPDVLDAGLISAAQKAEHYEIAGYGTVRTFAEPLGNKQAARLLQKTLDEEGRTDKKLTQLAESLINLEAADLQ